MIFQHLGRRLRDACPWDWFDALALVFVIAVVAVIAAFLVQAMRLRP